MGQVPSGAAVVVAVAVQPRHGQTPPRTRRHRWSIAAHVEDVSAEEMGRRAADLAGG